MKKFPGAIISAVTLVMLTGCSVFGKPGVEIAPYEVEKSDSTAEIRLYKEMVLVTTTIADEDRNDSAAFQRLFGYISGENTDASDISMTAPVVIDEDNSSGEQISMTAPVIMDETAETDDKTMSFVLPKKFTIDSAPRPTNPAVSLRQVTDLRVAVIRFSGFLSDSNVRENRIALEKWIEQNGYTAIGEYKSAGYNPPWTLPNLRRNEVMIPVAKSG